MRAANILRQSLFVLGLVLAAAAAYIFLPQAPPDLSEWESLGEAYDVRILRDTWGVPHIFGQTDADAAFGLAYAHSEDDFLTIQQVLLAARGQLATVYGAGAAPNDYMVHLLRIEDVVAAGYERDLSPETRAMLQGYADGLTFYAALHPEETLSADLFPVTARDMATASVHRSPLFFGIDAVLSDLFADERQSKVSDFGTESSSWPEDTSGAAAIDWAKSIAGSNGFALAPQRTKDGSTMLAVNSHQPWEGPVAWYEASVHSEEGWDMTGALFPVSPVIIHGHNRSLGWAFTVNHPDLVDVFVLEINPENENQYLFDGEWRDLEVRHEPIDVTLAGRLTVPVQQEFLWSVYGPVVRQPHGTYAIRFAGFGRVDIWEQLYRLNKAGNFNEWLAAMRAGGLPMFNVVYADREGNIYFLYNGLIPIRQEGWDWSLYIPGTSSETLWAETLPFDELPQVLNPSAGYIQNANSSPFQTSDSGNPDPERYSPTLGIETGMSNRSLRLREQLGGDRQLDFDDFAAVKWDMAYSTGSNIPGYVAVITAAQMDDADLRAGQALLREWDLHVDPENRSAALGVLTLYFINELADTFRPSEMVGLDTPDEVVLEAFSRAVDHLITHFGRLDVPWGEVNRLVRGNVNLGVGGGPDILHAVYGVLEPDGRLRGIAGDGVVYLVRWLPDGTVESRSIHQFGSATLDSSSPHYADQAPLFASRLMRPVWFDEADILKHLEAAYRPGER